MPKKEKHPKDMTTDETIAHVFHPDALKHLKKQVKELEAKPAKRSPKKSSK